MKILIPHLERYLLWTSPAANAERVNTTTQPQHSIRRINLLRTDTAALKPPTQETTCKIEATKGLSTVQLNKKIPYNLPMNLVLLQLHKN